MTTLVVTCRVRGRAVVVEAGRAVVQARTCRAPSNTMPGRGLDPSVAEQLGHAAEVAGVDALGVGVDQVLDRAVVVGHGPGW